MAYRGLYLVYVLALALTAPQRSSRAYNGMGRRLINPTCFKASFFHNQTTIIGFGRSTAGRFVGGSNVGVSWCGCQKGYLMSARGWPMES